MEKLKLLSRALLKENVKVLISNRKPALKKTDPLLPSRGTIEGIDYIYTSKPPYSGLNIFLKLISNFYGIFGELFLLIKLRKLNRLDAAIISSTHVVLLLYYRLLSKLLHFPLILSIAELHIAVPSKSLYHKFNNFLFDRFSFGIVDKVIPISEILEQRVQKFYPNKPTLKIPVLCDYSKFPTKSVNSEEKYFLFCGGAGYYEVIDFVVHAYEKIRQKEAFKLYLVINGNIAQMNRVKQSIIQSGHSSQIRLLSSLSYEELITLYQNAAALLIPLRDTLQDAARFPHKIGEYLAAQRPIITTNFGEIKLFFNDTINALICEKYDIFQYASKMEFVIKNPQKADVIGKEGYKLGLNTFHYEIYSNKLRQFIFPEKI